MQNVEDNLTEQLNCPDKEVTDKVYEVVMKQLCKTAKFYMAKERSNHTLEPEGLVNEVYLRLAKLEVQWQNRAHFFGVSASIMGDVLVDYARKRHAARRGGILKITTKSLEELKSKNVPSEIVLKLESLINQPFDNTKILMNAIKNAIGMEQTAEFESLILKHVKRGPVWLLTIDEKLDGVATKEWDIVEVKEALKKLEKFDPIQRQIVELRFFARLTIEQVAKVMGTSDSTVKREWKMAYAWLSLELKGE